MAEEACKNHTKVMLVKTVHKALNVLLSHLPVEEKINPVNGQKQKGRLERQEREDVAQDTAG
ncbi:Hypothetical predicted protein [Olea europaea subsp. europaea]|uniref:Uncharacterized protein n=1 Tax=Olea europaea subsp. europaea TaxID=158383 RepID=A0A8S0UKV6_OLEEU|nr:Hypothetical predicted protein [Olea europaea subsp. europaea]